MNNARFLILLLSALSTLSCKGENYTHMDVKGRIEGNFDLSAMSCINPSLCLIASDEMHSLQYASIDKDSLIVHQEKVSLGRFKKENERSCTLPCC
jgi:hypothetical protein